MTLTVSAHTLPKAFVDEAQSILGPKGWITDPSRIAPHIEDWRGRFQGHAPALALPANTDEAAAFVRACHAHGIAMLPQGGNTGLVDGGVPHGEVIINTARMTGVRRVDPLNNAVCVEAGCILSDVQNLAADHNLFFPLSLGSEGTARIGGLISTNAGGVAVLRYGMMRDLVLGLEVVLPDGQIWDGLTALRKNNTGYDLKQLFIGAEGTLGLITAATLKLFPRTQTATAWATLESADDAIELLAFVRDRVGDAVTGFELMSANALQMVLNDVSDIVDPLPSELAWRVLVEASTPQATHANEVLEDALAAALEAGLLGDVLLAQNSSQAQAFWRIRETIPLSKRAFGASLAHDISVPVSAIPEFLDDARIRVEAIVPGAEIVAFGHVGDGNLHYSVCVPSSGDTQAFDKRKPHIAEAVYGVVTGLRGAISAEHGIGREKRDLLAQTKSSVELGLMREIKRAIDPKNLMNPGRILTEQDFAKD